MAECYGYRPFVIAICNEKGEIKAGLPLMEVNSLLTGRRWVSLPFTDHCNPLYRGDTLPPELFEYLAELQIEHNGPRVELRSAISDDGLAYKDDSQVLHVQKLSMDTQAVHKSFNRNVRRSIAKAERKGVRVRWAESKRDLDIFYELHLKTRHRLGVPVQPRRYFELLWRRVINAGLGFILLAYKDAVPISGGVFLTYKTTLIAKYTASDSNYLRSCPIHPLYWTAIRWGCERGYNLFDLGRTDVNNTGLRNFKNGWGTQEFILTYSVMSASQPNPTANRLSGITESFIRRAPRWVCRITGELLYKHFA